MPSMRSSPKVGLVFSGASGASEHQPSPLSLEGFRDDAVEKSFLEEVRFREVGSLKENGVSLKGGEPLRCTSWGWPSFLLVLPFGEEFVFNLAAHSVFKPVVDVDDLDHHNILLKSVVELRCCGLSPF